MSSNYGEVSGFPIGSIFLDRRRNMTQKFITEHKRVFKEIKKKGPSRLFFPEATKTIKTTATKLYTPVTRMCGVPLAGRWRVSDVRVASAEARVTIYNRVR